MDADAMALCITRPSAAMVLTLQAEWVFVFHEYVYQLAASSQYQKNGRKYE